MNRKLDEYVLPKFEQGYMFIISKGHQITRNRKKKLREKLKDKFINWIFKDLIYDVEIKTTREKLFNLRKETQELNEFKKEVMQKIEKHREEFCKIKKELQELDRFKRETLKDIEQLYKNFNENEIRQDMFNESVYRFLPKVYEVYRKNLELNDFRKKYAFNSDAKELRKFTEEKIENEIKEILKRVDINE